MTRTNIQTRMTWARLLGVWLACSCFTIEASADELRLNAGQLFATSVSSNLRLSEDGSRLQLDRGVLVEDDGPAAGYSYRANEERLTAGLAIRKQLIIPHRAAASATLLVGGSGKFQFTVNDRPHDLPSLGKSGNYWEMFRVPVDALRTGENSIELRGEGRLWIARDDEYSAGSRERTKHPNRSAKSDDNGKTWRDGRLGIAGDVDGEYYLRLFLDQHRSTGELTTAVMDAGNLSGAPIAPPLKSIGPLMITVDGQSSETESIAVRVRSGPSPVDSDAGWSAWHELPNAHVLPSPAGRYFQIRATLATRDASHTPSLQSISVRATPQFGSRWHDSRRVIEFDNSVICRTSIPFEYEPLDRPELKRLREDYRLDEVVAGAASEFDLIVRLAGWSAKRFSHGGHLKTLYPAWNALDILSSHADGTPVGGFCQQYNIVFLQACESFGLVGRAVSIGPGAEVFPARGGHEVVEIWSNEFSKWVYVDGNLAWYALDAATEVPLSLRELRERQLSVLRGRQHAPVRIVTRGDSDRTWSGLTDWPPFVELRLIPRSNFLQRLTPLPLNQGMRGWFWTGHFVWTDVASPAPLLYSQRVAKQSDWDWTLNQACIVLEATATPGEVRVHLDTVTPSWATFECRIDGGPPTPVTSGWRWPLHSGRNRIEVRSQNLLGRTGPASVVVVE